MADGEISKRKGFLGWRVGLAAVRAVHLTLTSMKDTSSHGDENRWKDLAV